MNTNTAMSNTLGSSSEEFVTIKGTHQREHIERFWCVITIPKPPETHGLICVEHATMPMPADVLRAKVSCVAGLGWRSLHILDAL